LRKKGGNLEPRGFGTSTPEGGRGLGEVVHGGGNVMGVPGKRERKREFGLPAKNTAREKCGVQSGASQNEVEKSIASFMRRA